MFPPDYRADVRVVCITCDVVGTMENVGTMVVSQLLKTHADHDAHFDFINVAHVNDRKRARGDSRIVTYT